MINEKKIKMEGCHGKESGKKPATFRFPSHGSAVEEEENLVCSCSKYEVATDKSERERERERVRDKEREKSESQVLPAFSRSRTCCPTWTWATWCQTGP